MYPLTLAFDALLGREPFHFLWVLVEHLPQQQWVAMEAPDAIVALCKSHGLVLPKLHDVIATDPSSIMGTWVFATAQWPTCYCRSVFSYDVFELQEPSSFARSSMRFARPSSPARNPICM